MASKGKEIHDDAPIIKEHWSAFLYNKRAGTVLGRTGISWLKIGIFYAILYACLAGWFAGLLHAFYSTLDDFHPTHYGFNSLLQDNPALGVRPMPIYDSTMIRFAQGKKSSSRPYVDHLEAFFKFYTPMEGLPSCSETGVSNKTGCNMDIDAQLNDLGTPLSSEYGYYAGTPVVAVKMNKLYEFMPEPYANLEELKADLHKDEVLDEKKLSYSDGKIGISCDGQNALDRQFIHEIQFSPDNGIDMKYFPYLNQKGYRSPLMLVKFTDIEKRTTIQVNCRLWAKNIDNSDGKEKRGSVHFEFYID